MKEQFYCVDEFFNDPEKVLSFFKKSKFNKNDFYRKDGMYSGLRSICYEPWLHEELKVKLENLIDEKINKLDICFNINSFHSILGCPHTDFGYKLAGVVYLNKVAPKNTGTTLYEFCDIESIEDYSAKVQIMYCIDVPQTNHVKKKIAEEILQLKDKSKIIKKIENKFNRMLIYNAEIFHSGDFYFGTNMKNSRMSLAFFIS